MNRSRILQFLVAALAGVMTALPPATVRADDTEIYLGVSAAGEAIRPNVLFIMDTSGSMSALVSGTGKDRLDNMKEAFSQIMDTANNINVGLMRFTDPGGPVLWPISFIDEDASVIDAAAGVTDVNARVIEGDDDAEEVLSTGSVNLASPDLEIIRTAEGGSTATVTDVVASQSNNAEELFGDIITQNQIDMNSDQINAVRFSQVDIPVGATITDARIIFTARSTDSDAPTFKVFGEAGVNPSTFPTFCDDCSDVSTRAKTSANVEWKPGAWSTNEQGADTTTPNLKDIVQEIIELPGWTNGNPMVFIIDKSGSGGHRGAYTFNGSGGDASLRPELQVTFTTGASTEEQVIGIRFQNVNIPQGATINEAVLEVFPALTSDAEFAVEVFGQDSDDAQAFTSVGGDISARPLTGKKVEWGVSSAEPWDDLNIGRQTPNLAAVIQEIVDRPGWCGNNSLALIIRSDGNLGPRLVESFEGDPSRAPVLRVDFDEDSVADDACINSLIQAQIASSTDDAEERINTGGMALTGRQFDMRNNQINGLRFQNLAIAQGAQVLEATLTFFPRRTDTNASTLTFRAEASDTAETFTAAAGDISSRPTTTAAVTWNAPPFDTIGVPIETVDISSIIQEVVNRPGWQPGNSLVIVQSHQSGDQRRAITFNQSPIEAPVLRLRVQGAAATATKTVRQRLKEIVDDFDHEGFTPTVDTMLEAALYYRGEDVLWGKQRGFDNDPPGDEACFDPPHRCNASNTNDRVRRNTRVSHPGSWAGGTLERPPGCTEANLNAPECIGEQVTGNPVYTSPINDVCQANYIVLLTDGFANHNDSTDDIEGRFGLSCSGGQFGDETCGVELAEFLHEQDQIADMPGDQTIITYTIGFNFSSDFLAEVAQAGGGEFFTADTGAELANVFQTIIADILARSTSFAQPSLSVNAFNKLFDRNEVYFSLFVPDTRKRWFGNVKRYQLCNDSALCELGSVLDVNDDEAIDDSTQRIKDTAQSFWSAEIDGAEITLGGAASVTPDHATRNVFSFTTLGPVANPLDEPLDQAVHEIVDANDDGILDGLDGHPDHPDPLADTRTLLGDEAGVLSDQERADLIDWIRGRDVDDEDEDGSTSDNRFTFSDPLHSSPIAVTYGGDDADPVIKLFVGTNDGGLMMLNAANGIEEWMFYPQAMLEVQKDLRVNANGEHIYGVDLTPSPWIADVDQDGIIEDDDGDFVRIIQGMRRGGDSYFAFDVTPDSALTNPDATGEVLPTYLWRIDGPESGGTEYLRLGQSWSRPAVSSVLFGLSTADESEFRDVVAFGGGYDETQDDGFFGPGGLGNAIYIADAETGERLLWISGDDHGSGDGIVVPDMDCPIPSDLTFFDSNGDGGADRIYVGDLCGRVWRVDVAPDLTNSTGFTAVVGQFAELSDAAELEDQRKIFFRPSVVQVLNTEFSTTARFDLVAVVTGLRNNPLNLDVQDRAYALRDFHVEPLVDADLDGIVDTGTYDPVQGPTLNEAGTLFDATTLVNAEDLEESELEELQTADGWFIDLVDSGEKALAAPTILAGKLFFTTYLPEGVLDSATCALAEGNGRLYGVNALTGGVVFNWDDADGTDTLTASDKTFTLGAGIPSSAVPIFQEEGITLLIGGGGGATTVDPEIGLLRGRTYWYQQ